MNEELDDDKLALLSIDVDEFEEFGLIFSEERGERCALVFDRMEGAEMFLLACINADPSLTPSIMSVNAGRRAPWRMVPTFSPEWCEGCGSQHVGWDVEVSFPTNLLEGLAPRLHQVLFPVRSEHSAEDIRRIVEGP